MSDLVRLPALTLHDPWARLCVAGIKTLETRCTPVLSGFRGPLVIHRSKQPEDADYLNAMGWPPAPTPPWGDADTRGCAIGVVLVGETIHPDDWPCTSEETRRELRDDARYMDLDGRWLSDLRRAAWFPAPLPARGMQGRWWIEVPEDYLPEWARPACTLADDAP